MFCDTCNEEIPDDSIFCPECGARQNLSKASVLFLILPEFANPDFFKSLKWFFNFSISII